MRGHTVFMITCSIALLIGYQMNVQKHDEAAALIRNQDPIILKIYADDQGNIFLNDKKITITELDVELKKLEGKNGVVHFSRENPTGDQAREGMEVVQMVMKYQLQLVLYKDKAFKVPVEESDDLF